MNFEIEKSALEQAVKEEQKVADEAHIEHLQQRVGVLRAAVDQLIRENEQLRAQVASISSDGTKDPEASSS